MGELMKSVFVVVLFVLAASTAGAQDANSVMQQKYEPALWRDCQNWTEDRWSGNAQWAFDERWIAGYLSALNVRHPMPSFWSVISRVPLHEKIDTICAESPNKLLHEAAEALWIKSGGIIDPDS